MRWDNLFDDLESQLGESIAAEGLDLGAEEHRLRLGQLHVSDRLQALHAALTQHHEVKLTVVTGERLSLRLASVGRDWIAADVNAQSSHRSRCIVPLWAIASISLPPWQVASSLADANVEGGHPSGSARIGLPVVLRDLCRRRSSVEVAFAGGSVHGTIDRVGRDHVDLAVHESGSARRDSAVDQVQLIPLSSIVIVRV